MVEKYLTKDDAIRWRTLDDHKNDWRDGFLSREEAAQDLVTQCPRVVRLIEHRRARLQSQAEDSVVSAEING